MKTIVKIDPDKEYELAKKAIASIGQGTSSTDQINCLDSSVDNLKTVINVLIERATPKERTKPPKKSNKNIKKENKESSEKLPSQKFPDLEVEENIVRDDSPPICGCCNSAMQESGLYKTSEKLEVIPKRYYIVRNKRVVYNCPSCYGEMKNAEAIPSICPSSNYGDSVMIDVSLSKFCDLVPIERYSAMAARDGVEGLAPNSLIGLTHNLANFLYAGYEALKSEVQSSRLVFIDETPHKMLEGDDRSSWYLWGFSCTTACIFEAHPSRSGDVAFKFLSESLAEFILTDGYRGYQKAVRQLSEQSKTITEANCNAHAYRYFEEASVTWESECQDFLRLYGEIYALERQAKLNPEQKPKIRSQMQPLFEDMASKAREAKESAMPNSGFMKALGYFLGHYEKLTKCTYEPEIELDNNFSERLLRNPVVGRKTWYGTHSKRGARTSAIIFSLVESCKINRINPRNYFVWLTKQILAKETVLTPYQYLLSLDSG